MSLNMDIAVGRLNPPTVQLRQADAVALQLFAKRMGERRFNDAFEALGTHLRRTEATRRTVQGAGPTWEDALAAFETALVNHVLVGVGLRERDKCAEAANSTPAVSAPLTSPAPRHLQLVPQPPCGHRSEFMAHMFCANDAGHEAGQHYYRSSRGSEVHSVRHEDDGGAS